MINIAKKVVKTSSKRPVYNKSEDVKNAEKKLSEWEKNKPGEYKSKYEKEIDRLLDNVLNREDFSYDVNSDPMYQQYKELYMGNGKKAMRDTIGNASALTGGYANSYATTAGYQAYSEYLNQLNGVSLGLRDRAYEMYKDEGDKLIENISLLRELDGDDYEKYLGKLETYYKDGNYLLEKLSQMSDSEYEKFLASVEAWENDRDYNFKRAQDKLDRQEFEKELAFKKSEAQRDQANKDREYKLAKSKSSGSSNSQKTEKKEYGENFQYPTTYGEFCFRTGYSGVMTYSEFNRSTYAKKEYGSYRGYLRKMYVKYSQGGN